MSMLFWIIATSSGIVFWQTLRQNFPTRWAQAMQQPIIVALAALACRSGSTTGLCGTLVLFLLSTVGLNSFYRRLETAVHSRDPERARALNRWTRLLFWGQFGSQLCADTEAACRDLEADVGLLDEKTVSLRWLTQQSNQREWTGVTVTYHELVQQASQPLDCWVHLVACRAYARLGELEAAAECLDQTMLVPYPAPRGWPALYATMVFSLAGSMSHFEFWLRLIPEKEWPPQSRLHSRALCLACNGQTQAALEAWAQVAAIAAPDFLPYIESDVARAAELAVEAKPALLDRFQRTFASLQASARLSQARLGFGGRSLITLTVLAFALQAGDLRDCGYLSWGSLQQGQSWRLLSHLFVHYNLAHLLFNMLALATLGAWVESLFGWRILVIYFVSGVVAGLAQVLFTPLGYLIGASGAVMAVLGARAAILWRLRNLNPLFRRYQVKTILFCILLQSVADLLIPHVGGVAHMTGLAVGFFLALCLPLRLE